MPADIVHEDNPVMVRIARKTTPPAALAALGPIQLWGAKDFFPLPREEKWRLWQGTTEYKCHASHRPPGTHTRKLTPISRA